MSVRHAALAAGLLPVLTVAAFLTSGCHLLRPDRHVLVLPPVPPAHWQAAFPGLQFVVSCGDAEGRPAQNLAMDWRTPVEVVLSRSPGSAVVAWPCGVLSGWDPYAEPRLLRPAGGFYPSSLRSMDGREVLELTWEDGPAALVVDRVAAAGRDMSLFNVQKLREVFRRSADPWCLDLDRVAQEIAEGDLTVWDIDPLPGRDVTAHPGTGTWFVESPFPGPVASSAGAVLLQGVAFGSHWLFSFSGARYRLEVAAEETLLIAQGP